MPMVYKDFDLRIDRSGDVYRAEVTRSPVGASAREDLLSWPFGNEPDRMLLVELENAILKSRNSRSGLILSPEEKILRQFGADLFRCVLRESGTVATIYRDSVTKVRKLPDVGLRINLRVEPPEMANLPWEYVFDEQSEKSYLCLRSKYPVVRRLSAPAQARATRKHAPVRVLAMLVNLSGEWSLKDAERERRSLGAIFQAPGLPVEFCWNLRATKDSLYELMEQGPWDIFHFIGHGGTEYRTDADNQSYSEGFVVMDDGEGKPRKVRASELANMLEPGDVKLAVFNCCEGARGSSSVAASLVAAGIPMAIAMQFAITDASAVRFSEGFYRKLVAGHTVERALTAARNYVHGESDAEWALPVLFTQANSSTFFEARLGGDAITTAAIPAPVPEVVSPSPPPDDEHTKSQMELRRLWGLT